MKGFVPPSVKLNLHDDSEILQRAINRRIGADRPLLPQELSDFILSHEGEHALVNPLQQTNPHLFKKINIAMNKNLNPEHQPWAGRMIRGRKEVEDAADQLEYLRSPDEVDADIRGMLGLFKSQLKKGEVPLFEHEDLAKLALNNAIRGRQGTANVTDAWLAGLTSKLDLLPVMEPTKMRLPR